MPAAVTLRAASVVAVYQDTLEMNLPAQVNKNICYRCARNAYARYFVQGLLKLCKIVC